MKWCVHNKTRFQVRLEHMVQRRIILLVLISSIAFLLGQYATTWVSSQQNAKNHLQELEDSLVFFDSKTRELLSSSDTEDVLNDLVVNHNTEAIEDLKSIMWKFHEKNGIASEIIVIDNKQNIVYTSYGESFLSSYFLNYNNAICYNAKNNNSSEIYRAVYYEKGYYADTIYVKPIVEQGKIQGYASVFVSGSGWNFYLAESNYDGVITDLRDNAMYVSKPGLLRSVNKYQGKDSGLWRSDSGPYIVVSKALPELSAIVYSLVYFPPMNGMWIAILILACMGVSWYGIAQWISRTMAEKNSDSIKQLVREIRIIDKGDIDHRITLDTDDEFDEVGQRINEMIQSIMYLNQRNTELAALNSRIEMEQLTAQMNPHFLYNTLEIIRNLVVFDAAKSEQMILDLTMILRYCVDSTKQEVLLSEDLEYVQRYLNIQNCRFGDRFSCELNINDECLNWNVPKLLIQPLIENSIKYAFRKKMDLSIKIDGYVDNGILYIHIVDDGLGMEEDAARTLDQQLSTYEKSTRSIGLRNLSRRLHLKYGNTSGLRIKNDPGVGFEVMVCIDQRGGSRNV